MSRRKKVRVDGALAANGVRSFRDEIKVALEAGHRSSRSLELLQGTTRLCDDENLRNRADPLSTH